MDRNWYRVERNAASTELFIFDEIGAYGITSKQFVNDLRRVSSPVLRLHINSPGGSVDDGLAIFNWLKSYPGTVETYNDALAASIASVIFMAGEKRIMAPHSRLMMHEAMAMGMGFASDFEKMTERLRDCTQNIAEIYAETAGDSVDNWLGRMAEETWYGADEAVAAGLATEVGRDESADAFKIAANFNLSRFRKAPKIEAPEVERNQMGASTVAAMLASEVYEAFTDCVEEWIEGQQVTVAEAVALNALLGELLTTLQTGVSRLNLGDRAVPDDDMECVTVTTWDSLDRQVGKVRRGLERNAGRAMSQANLDRVHQVMTDMDSVHSGVCDMGDSCPMSGPMAQTKPAETASATAGGEDPSPINARKRAVDQILASVS